MSDAPHSNTPLSNTAHVILGFLSRNPMSGYEIKQKIDISTRFFFAASYGQIYPELKKLEERGLIVGEAKSQGQRARTEYSLTAAGMDVLRQWLISPGNSFEMRDEGILKLFFSITNSREEQIQRVTDLRAARSEWLDELTQIKQAVGGEIPDMPLLVLEYGIELSEFIIGWCDRTLVALGSQALSTSPKE